MGRVIKPAATGRDEVRNTIKRLVCFVDVISAPLSPRFLACLDRSRLLLLDTARLSS